jgi:peptidoglycan hydrolase-like protein with peptidoglycan-binding domain
LYRFRKMLVILAVSHVAAAAPAHAYNWTRTLKQGDSGADVTELQIRVAGWAADGASQSYVAVDGSFGPGTASAVKRFQYAYRLPVTGSVSTQMETVLTSLEKSDGSTAHFDWTEFTSHDGVGFTGGKVSETEVTENVRRLMYKLEALRKKLGNSPVTINSGFRSVAYNTSLYGYETDSQHQYGIAADVAVSGHGTQSVYQAAETCGFSGLEAYTNSWQHCDSRIEHAYGAQYWWWESGVSALPGAFADPPSVSDVSSLLQAGGGLRGSTDITTWDVAPNPSSDARGFGDGRFDLLDAVRALRRAKGLETRWP